MSHPPIYSPAAFAGRAPLRPRARAAALGVARRWAGQGLRVVGAQAALVWLLLALVVAPTLGRLHQVTHGSTLDRVHAGRVLLALQAPTQAQAQGLGPLTLTPTPAQHPALAAAPAQPAGAVPASSPGLFDLLAGHHSAADCLLLDQLALGDALYSIPMVVPAPVLAQAPPAPPADRVGVLHVTLFHARGPPVV